MGTTTVTPQDLSGLLGGDSPNVISHLEVRAHGHVVVDGHSMDIRGGLVGADMFYRPSAFAIVELKKTATDTYTVTVTQAYASDHAEADKLAAATYQDADLPAYTIWPSAEAQAAQTIATSHDDNVTTLTRLEELQRALRGVLTAEHTVLQTIEQIAHGFPESARAKAHDFIYYVMQYAYVLVNDAATSTADKTRWCEEIVKGPTDVPVNGVGAAAIRDAVVRFFQQAHKIDAAPTVPSGWVTPSTGVRTDLENLETLSAAGIPDTADFLDDTWVDDINLPPEAGTAPDPVSVAAAATEDVDMAPAFVDEDALTYTAVSDDDAVATVSVSGSTVTVTGVAAGTATVTVTATDTASQTATATIAVTVT